MVRKDKGEALSQEAVAMRSVAREIATLQDLNLAELKARFTEVYGEAPKSKNLPFLRKKIAYRIQEQLEGGLSEAAQARLLELAPAELGGGKAAAPRREQGVSFKQESRPVARDPRLPRAGTTLTREYKHFAHEVQVLEDGFLYRGRTYGSLSAIAKEITGTPWNGFLFFGLIQRGGLDGR